MKLSEFPKSDNPQQCPCCDYFSLAERGMSLVCPVCFWEDDCLDYSKPDWDAESDTNDNMTLREARKNFIEYGICHIRFSEVVIESKERKTLRYVPRSV